MSDLWQVGVFFPGTPIFSTNKTDHYDITKILLKVALTTIEKTQLQCINFVLNPYFDSGAVNICQQWHELYDKRGKYF